MYQLDVRKNELSQVINSQQRQLNNSNNQRLKENRSDIIKEIQNQRQARNSTEYKANIHKNLADIQKDQIKLRKIDAANDLIKNRIEDEQNLLKIHERFPYGKENVGISEDVLERYRGNYIQQSKMLQKFRMQAQLMKKTSRVKKNNSKPFNWCYRDDPNDNRKKQQELRRMRETMQRQYEQERALRQFEKHNMKKITQTLSGLSLQLHNNSYTLEKGIRQLRHQLKKTQKKPIISQPKHTYRDILDIETSTQKIPVVVYKNQPMDARLYFSDIFKITPKVIKQQSSNLHKEEYKQLMRVLVENNRRIKYLDKLQASENDN